MESMTNEQLLIEYKKCISILCREVFDDKTNDNIYKQDKFEKEILKRMK